jgi:hypothetical protein
MAFSPSQMVFKMKPADTSRAFEEGKFSSGGQRELAAENKRIAVVTQSFVVRYMEQNLKRPGVATGRLARVTANPDNVYASSFVIGVGKPSYLDKSMAKYWRTIEEGSAVTWKKRSFLTLDLLGVFGATINGRYAGPRFTLPGRTTGGKFRPVRPNPETGEARFGRVVLRPFHPRHEIEPMGAYTWAYAQGRFPEQGIAAARRYLDWLLNTGVGQVIAGKDFKPPTVE